MFLEMFGLRFEVSTLMPPNSDPIMDVLAPILKQIEDDGVEAFPTEVSE